jgi:hypothetical protein
MTRPDDLNLDDEFPPGWRARAEEMFSIRAEKARRYANPNPRRGTIIGRRRQEPRKVGKTGEAQITGQAMDRMLETLFAPRRDAKNS